MCPVSQYEPFSRDRVSAAATSSAKNVADYQTVWPNDASCRPLSLRNKRIGSLKAPATVGQFRPIPTERGRSSGARRRLRSFRRAVCRPGGRSAVERHLHARLPFRCQSRGLRARRRGPCDSQKSIQGQDSSGSLPNEIATTGSGDTIKPPRHKARRARCQTLHNNDSQCGGGPIFPR